MGLDLVVSPDRMNELATALACQEGAAAPVASPELVLVVRGVPVVCAIVSAAAKEGGDLIGLARH